MIVYFAGQVVLYWYFALQYLRTAQTLSHEVQRRLNTNVQSSGPPNESSNLLAVDTEDERVQTESACTRCCRIWMTCCNVCCFIWIALIILYFLSIDISLWDCDLHVEDESVDNQGCSKPEKWFGSVYGLVNFLGLILYTRIFSTIIFVVALCKITKIVGKIA